MTRLTQVEQDLILEFYFHATPPEENGQGSNLIASNPHAATLYGRLDEALTGTDPVAPAPCPDHLAKLTIARLKLLAGAS